MLNDSRLGSSFRDPDGYVFREGGKVLRFVAPLYVPTLSKLESSGLLEILWKKGLLVRHSTVKAHEDGHVLEPEQVGTISYPYEWCFSQLKDAALLTLEIQSLAIERGFSLKDSSAYNVQFSQGAAIFIDTLSFEIYEEGKPWKAYRQFCEHFLAPLALMSRVDARLNKLLASFIDGVPLEIASKALPLRTRFSAGLGMHIHLHARAKASASATTTQTGTVSRIALLGLVDSLRRTVSSLHYEAKGTVWGNYYEDTNYSKDAFEAKKEVVRRILSDSKATRVWDLGANTGEFSQLAAEAGIPTVAWDFDVAAVEKSYQSNKGNPLLLPLVLDLTNPSPALGWANEERDSFSRRSNADLVMALALIHHLAIGNNVPLGRVAKFFAELAPQLIIEFVPREDSQVQRLLSTRADIYLNYNLEGFLASFSEFFEVREQVRVEGTHRDLFLMRRR